MLTAGPSALGFLSGGKGVGAVADQHSLGTRSRFCYTAALAQDWSPATQPRRDRHPSAVSDGRLPGRVVDPLLGLGASAPLARVLLLVGRSETRFMADPGPSDSGPASYRKRLLRLQRMQKWRNRIHGRDFHPCSPPPARQPPADCRGGKGQGKEILNAGFLVSAHTPERSQRPMLGHS